MATVRIESTFVVEGVTAQQCWDYLEDVDNSSEWNTFVQRAEALDPPGVGRRIRSHVGFLGITFPVEAVSAVSEEPTHSVIEGTKPFTSQIGARMRDIEGGVEMTTWVEMSPGTFFPVLKFVLKKAVERQYDRDMALLRSKLEALAD
jgi:hypothetical protein